MNTFSPQLLKTYFFWAAIVGLILMAFMIVFPFAVAIISAYLLAYVAKPLYEALLTKFSNYTSAAICVVVIILLLVVPTALVMLATVGQVGDTISGRGLSRYVVALANHPYLEHFNINSADLLQQVNALISDITANFIASLPSMGIALMITLIGTFYFLAEWKILTEHLKQHMPFKNKERVVRELGLTTNTILYGTLVMALLEFLITFLGFMFLGVEASLILAVIIFILAFIPSIGPIFLWLPLAGYYLVNQNYETALGVIVIGLILTVGIEIFLYTKWIGDRTRIHPFVMLIGVIGGITIFGIFGFIIGPLVLAIALEMVEEAVQS